MNFVVLTKTGGMILGPIASLLGIIMDGLFKFTSSFGVMNIGLCIILFTLVVKLLMFPLTIKQQKSSKLMSIMQPEVAAIQKKYKGKSDQESMMKQNVEIQALYEKYGVSMTGGCLQLVIQMPILLALYRVIYNIPAYVSFVKDIFMGVVNALPADAPATLTQFAADNSINLKMIGEIAGPDKIVDFLYLLNPTQWHALQGVFPAAADIISQNSAIIEEMNAFAGINLATAPFHTGFVPNIAWIIPILAGLTQWFSVKLMTSAQPASNSDAPGANMMQSMNLMMPIMSAVFCFTFPAAIGIYWIASSVFQIIQQMAVNSFMNKMDIDEMIQKNVEKANKKREKKGLPPTKVTSNASASLKNIQAETEKEEAKMAEKLAKTEKIVKESTEYYNSSEPKPGSLAAKANMVKKYNEKHNK